MKNIFSTAVAVLVGLIVLAGYFFDIPALTSLRGIILGWAVVLAAVAVFIGVFNLLMVHSGKIKGKQKGRAYSLLLVISLLVVLVIGLVLGPDHPAMEFIFSSFQLPVEASLMALLVVTLLYASIRLLKNRKNIFSVIFLAVALLVLLGMAPLPIGEIPVLGDVVRPFIAQVLAAAGARGILIGVALGALTTGLRILLGTDRPYGVK